MWKYLPLVLLACGNDVRTSSTAGLGTQASSNVCADTWQSFGAAFFADNCAACHFDMARYAVVEQEKDGIRTMIASDRMPKEITLPADVKAQALAFLDCDLPVVSGAKPTQAEFAPTKGGYCAVCTDDADCSDDAMCIFSSDGKTALCGQKCKTSADCETTAQCRDIKDEDGKLLAKSCYPKSGTCDAPPSKTESTCDAWSSVGPLFATYCSSCHTWSKSESQTKRRAVDIVKELEEGAMPPSDAEATPEEWERANMARWASCASAVTR